MLVMLLVVDVVPHVVQQRRVGERLPILRVAAEARSERIEELQRQLSHLTTVRCFVVAAFREGVDRAGPRFAGIRHDGADLGGFEEEPFADAERRRRHLPRLDPREDLRRHGETRHDQVGPTLVEPGTARRSAGVIVESSSSRCSTCWRGIRVPCTLGTRIP